jgi:CRISPR-associated protein Cas8a1/Csx13
MGTRVARGTPRGGSLTADLFGPGMTALHKVGVAGLWMTLAALDEDSAAKARLKSTGASWRCDSTSVTISWADDPRGVFTALFREAFKIDTSGLLWFPALGTPVSATGHAIVLQGAMLNSFLQHGLTRQADPSQDPRGAITITVDEVPIPLQFHRVRRYAHQRGAFSATSVNRLAGWLFPGGAVRHVGLGNTSALEDPPERAIALRFAPVGAIYFQIQQRGGGVRPRYVVVLPEITDCAAYARVRRHFLSYGVRQLYAAGVAEAGYRVLTELEAAGVLPGLRTSSCRVIAFGTAPWSSQQKSRVHLLTVRANSGASLRLFRLAKRLFPSRLVKPDSGQPFWDVPQLPNFIARNLSEGRLWWEGFGDFVADHRRRDHVFAYEKGGLSKMVTDADALPESPERTLVDVCHAAWRRRLGELGDRARREGISFSTLVNREFVQLRSRLLRAKTPVTLREVLVEFWSRAGASLPPLRNRWADVLPLLDEKHWRTARDLALLALASYAPATREEEKVLASTASAPSEGEDVS